MRASSKSAISSEARKDYFVTTRWTLVLAAGRKPSVQSHQALTELCQTYWYPLYAYVRRQGRSREDAEDLTQAFFAQFLQKNYLEGLSNERGKFRAFLLACLKHYVANEVDKANRQKRGGQIPHLSLDWESADKRYGIEPPDPRTLEVNFDREWAIALLERVIARLEKEYAASGKGRFFEKTKGILMLERGAVQNSELARSLDMEEGTFRVAVHRLRKRYRELLREEIGQTLSEPSMVEEELRSLQAALR